MSAAPQGGGCFLHLSARTAPCPPLHHPPPHPPHPPTSNPENDYNVLAEYYGLPSLSFRNAVWPLMQANKTGFRVDLPTDCAPGKKKYVPVYCPRYRKLIAARGGNPDAINPTSQLFSGEGTLGGRVAASGACLALRRQLGRGGGTAPPPPPPPSLLPQTRCTPRRQQGTATLQSCSSTRCS